MPERPAEVRSLLHEWLARRVAPEAAEWLAQRCAAYESGVPEQELHLDFSGALRRTGKSPLRLSAEDLERATAARPGWNPSMWTTPQAARVLLVLAWPAPDAERYVAVLDDLFESADLGELIALYQALPVYPHQGAHVRRCTEGVRTNMTDVFKAVVHRNPYPSEHLDERAWNQMVLKALFVGVALHPIHGLDARANPALARMLLDYAHERWAARRDVSPELWRCVGPHADDAALADLERVLTEGSEVERRAAALALRASPRPGAAVLLDRHPVELPAGCDWTHLG